MGSIPPNIRGNVRIDIGIGKVNLGPKSTQNYKAKKKILHYTKMRTQTLKEILLYAEELREKFLEALKIDNSDENIKKFNGLDKTILQLKNQIAVREGGER